MLELPHQIKTAKILGHPPPADAVESAAAQSAYETYCKPHLAKRLSSLKLGRTFHKAQGNYLFEMRGNTEVKILDGLGGYGSTLLGHNHPELKQEMLNALDKDVVVHGQLSLREEAGRVGAKLQEMLNENQVVPDSYITCLVNTGAEAVEAGLKHAYLAWKTQQAKAIFRVKKRLIAINDETNGAISDEDTRRLVSLLESALGHLEAARPVIFAVEGSFHGKTLGALSVTANESYREMYGDTQGGFGLRVVFLDPQMSKDELASLLESHTLAIPDFKDFSNVAAVILEIIQGEGGVVPLPPKFLNSLQELCHPRRIPKIIDEIQTGLYRTGSFVASRYADITPDYLLLGKILGGGLVKVAALVIRSSFYEDEFELKHSSTFADDGLSSLVALKTLEILSAKRAALSRDAARFESYFRSRLELIDKKYPGVICDVRGRGYLIGIEFAESLPSGPSNFHQALVESGYLGYVYASFLLERHNIRVAPTLSQPHTLRIEPPAFLSDGECDSILDALEDLVQRIANRQFLGLTAHIFETQSDEPAKAWTTSSTRTLAKQCIQTVCFLSHVVDKRQLRDMDPVFDQLDDRQREFFLDELAPAVKPVLYHDQLITGANGREVRFTLLGLPLPSKFFEQQLRSGGYAAFEKINEAMKTARKLGATHLGLGQYTSILSMNGQLLDGQGVHITTGNSLTVGLAYRGLEHTCTTRQLNLAHCTVGVVGAAGNIGRVIAQLLGDKAAKLVLIHRVAKEHSPKFASAAQDILNHIRLSPDNVVLSSHLSDLQGCDLVVIGTNATEPLELERSLKQNACVLDVSVPANIPLSLKSARPDLTILQGGFAALPLGQTFYNPLIPAPPGEVFACMAETIMTGLTDYQGHFSFGNLTKENVLKSLKAADHVGMRLGTLKTPEMECNW